MDGSPSRRLTVDLGNSRLKLRVWRLEGGRRAGKDGAAELEGDGRLVDRLAGWLRTQDRLDGGALSSVADADLTGRVAAVLGSFLGTPLDVAPDPGLDVRVEAPEEVGRDRLYAARGAHEALDRACVVVDAGTAVTVDALGAGGAFLGGAIAAGPTLLGRAIGDGAARLFEVEARPGDPALGRDTSAALRAGVAHGFRGAVAELVEAVARDAGLGGAPVALTGGARGFLLVPEPFCRREIAVLPDLVHLGLLHAHLAATS